MLTVRNDEQHKVAALDAGADDYVIKPFSTPELMARIRSALRRDPLTAGAGQQQLILESVEIDFATRRIHTKNRELRLTTQRSQASPLSLFAPQCSTSFKPFGHLNTLAK